MDTQSPNRLLAGLTCLALLMACDGKGPTDPGPAASLSMNAGTDLLKINASETFAVTKIPSGGPPVPVSARWSSDDQGVASVDMGGRVTGIASGRATIAAEAEGMRATARVRVVPDYQGRWEGMTLLTDCAADGDFRGTCEEAAGNGLFFRMTVSQNRDALTGEVDFDGVRGSIAGPIQQNGRFTATATMTLVVEGVVFEVALTELDAETVDNLRLTGRFRLEIRHVLLSGSWRISGELADIRKTASTALTVLPSARPSPARRSAAFERFRQIARRAR
jgi:hypothetical protein